MARRKRSQTTVTPRAKVWLEVDGNYVFGLGICAILEAVEQNGTIKEAAAAIGKSYRHVWSRIKEVERAIGISLVSTQRGGAADTRRSDLTEPARQLVASYRDLRAQVFSLVEGPFSSSIQEIVTRAANTRAAKKSING